MWDADTQQYAVAYVVFSSVFGSVLGPIVGGFVEQYVSSWRWTIWIQLIFGGFVQACHFFLVPETRSTIMMDRIAKKRRKATGENIWGPNELEPFRDRFSAKEVLITWIRPFKMFLTEPIVLTLSLLSGFSDALIFMFIQSFALVYKQWNFAVFAVGLAFLPLGIGYIIAWISFIPAIKRNINERKSKPGDERAQYESRLWWLLYTAPCLPIGLFGFAWTIQGPPIHWIGSMIFASLVGIANYAIYMATIDYMICAYGPYSASATGGNGWSRDFLAGVLTVPATPFFTSELAIPLPFQDPEANNVVAQTSEAAAISIMPAPSSPASPHSSLSPFMSSMPMVQPCARDHLLPSRLLTRVPITKAAVSRTYLLRLERQSLDGFRGRIPMRVGRRTRGDKAKLSSSGDIACLEWGVEWFDRGRASRDWFMDECSSLSHGCFSSELDQFLGGFCAKDIKALRFGVMDLIRLRYTASLVRAAGLSWL
jgi:MFS family permease